MIFSLFFIHYAVASFRRHIVALAKVSNCHPELVEGSLY